MRGQVYMNSWYVEPYGSEGSDSMITFVSQVSERCCECWSCVLIEYCCQVAFNGRLPTSVVNLVSTAQPLCIAALRGYLKQQLVVGGKLEGPYSPEVAKTTFKCVQSCVGVLFVSQQLCNRKSLTALELSEIDNYDQIYFVGYVVPRL